MSQSSLSGERCVSLLIAPQSSCCLDLLKSFGKHNSNKSGVNPSYELPYGMQEPSPLLSQESVLVRTILGSSP